MFMRLGPAFAWGIGTPGTTDGTGAKRLFRAVPMIFGRIRFGRSLHAGRTADGREPNGGPGPSYRS
ncbi:hypothetical protein OV450_7272 [Actinobacteria bacterium OV450]|nr:hypothetical protein OV450_7272 [Actinobacteria bacterium OV450]